MDTSCAAVAGGGVRQVPLPKFPMRTCVQSVLGMRLLPALQFL
ncbi:hypothetical protein [Nocardia sp. NPDC003183]